MEYEVLKEGSTSLKVPKDGGISKDEEVFYNPHMALNRDLTVAYCRILKPKTFVDLMAGSGARGIRVAREASIEVTLNDLNPKAIDTIKENAALNGVNPTIESLDARVLLAGRRFDFIDLDPFGPPVAFMDSVISASRWGNTVGVCATDTSALCGSYPKACQRKYDATPLRCDAFNEVGLRILLGFIARTALRHESGIEPLFCHCTRHYMRVQFRYGHRYNDTLKQLGYFQYCFSCHWRGYRALWEFKEKCSCGDKLRSAGPLWTGVFAEEEFCKRLLEELLTGTYQKKTEAVKLVDDVAQEQPLNVPYIDLHKLCSKTGDGIPRMTDLSERLKKAGYSFVRTHFNPVGFRTDMQFADVSKMLGDMQVSR